MVNLGKLDSVNICLGCGASLPRHQPDCESENGEIVTFAYVMKLDKMTSLYKIRDQLIQAENHGDAVVKFVSGTGSLLTGDEVIQTISHKIVIESLTDGGYNAEVPALKGCIAYGETPQEALETVLDVEKAWLEIAKERGWVL
jgi:predicted RNase H-like HicB family nuclease